MSRREDSGSESSRYYQEARNARQQEARERKVDDLLVRRMSKRKDILTKRREIDGNFVERQQELLGPLPSPEAVAKKLEGISEITRKVLWSDDSAIELEATKQFKNLISIERRAPIDELIKVGVIPRFLHFLARDDVPELQFEVLCVLGNVASGSHGQTQILIGNGAIPKILRLLSSTNDGVRGQAVWTLGNIAGDCPYTRDLLCSHGARSLLRNLLNDPSPSIRSAVTSTLTNIDRGIPVQHSNRCCVHDEFWTYHCFISPQDWLGGDH